MKFNVVLNQGVRESVTVFLDDGSSQVATKDHPNFDEIVQACQEGYATDQHLRDLFDVGYALDRRFTQLSERVSVNKGRIFFDGVEIDNALTQAIVRFFTAGNEDFLPLVNFMEKIEQNRSDACKQHLFAWLGTHNFSICPDGDFIAYKGVTNDLFSTYGGEAAVNGETVIGRIPNAPGTVITMPRTEVDPSSDRACSTGLHAANWGFAKSFSQAVVRIKINPRDVVSVPASIEANKLRVCRYRVIDLVTAEDTSSLYVGDPERTARVVRRPTATQKPPRKGAKRVLDAVLGVKLPLVYEEFTKADFKHLSRSELRGLAKTWEVPGTDKAKLIERLAQQASLRRRGLA